MGIDPKDSKNREGHRKRLRFSTKLRNLISKNRGKVDFIDINNIRFKIEKK